MSLSVTTLARTQRLTRLEHVKRELQGTLDDTILRRMLDAASAAIRNYCQRSFAREAVVELLPGYEDIHLQLTRRPLITVSLVALDGDVVTDYTIADRDQGLLYRRDGWIWTRQVSAGLSGRQRWPGFGQPIPRSEEPRFGVTYVAGYILPEQFLEGVSTISVDASDQSFNDSGNGFPLLLQAGDVLVSSGLTQSANNGRFLVTGTPTAGKVLVSGAGLATEAAGASATITFEPPADCQPFTDLEEAAIKTTKSWWMQRSREMALSEKRVGDFQLRWNDGLALERLGLPPDVVGLLTGGGWVNRAA